MKDPVWRKQHAAAAGKAGGRAKRVRVLLQLKDTDNVTAYRKGYRQGYLTAYQRWKVWAEDVVSKRAKERVA